MMEQWILFAHNGVEYGPAGEKELVSWIKERRISYEENLEKNKEKVTKDSFQSRNCEGCRKRQGNILGKLW